MRNAVKNPTTNRNSRYGLIAASGRGSVMLRRLLPVAIALPALLGWAWFADERAKILGPRLGLGLFTLTNIVMFVVLLYAMGIWLNRANMARRRAGDRDLQLTAIQRAQEALLQSQNQLQGIIHSAMDAVITVDSEQRVMMFNTAAERMFLCPSREALGQPLGRFIPERFRATHDRHVAHFGKTGVTSRAMGALGTLSGLRANGEEFPIEASISQIESGGNKLYTAIVRDVTDRQRSEQSLREQASVLDLAQVLVRDTEDRIVLWTRGIAKLYGYSRGEALGRYSHELLRTEFPEPLAGIHEKLFRNGFWEGELSHYARNGRRMIVASLWVLERDHHGHPLRVLEADTDITERKQMEESLLQSQKMQALGTLAGGIAHDFNNILLAITGNTRLAIEDLSPDHPVQQSLKEIVQGCTRASALVRQILTFSRRQEASRKTIDIRPVLEEGLALLRATLPARVEIRKDFADGLLPISATSTQIHQIIMNLGTNAARAIGEKPGVVEIRAMTQKIHSEHAGMVDKLKPGVYVRLSARDTGCGMDSATLERIFEPFFTTQPVGQGTGLGLAVVHGIMKDHGGYVSAYSEPGKGTVLNLYFPVSTEVRQEAMKTASGVRRGGGEELLD